MPRGMCSGAGGDQGACWKEKGGSQDPVRHHGPRYDLSRDRPSQHSYSHTTKCSENPRVF
eukprot:7267357-Pyramimonas_sp.AAC.1